MCYNYYILHYNATFSLLFLIKIVPDFLAFALTGEQMKPLRKNNVQELLSSTKCKVNNLADITNLVYKRSLKTNIS